MSSETRIGKRHADFLREGTGFLLLSLVVPIVLISLAEFFFFTKHLELPITLHGINLLYCVMVPLLLNLRPQLFQAFSLVSVLRMMNIGMPVFFDMTIYWLPFIYLPVIVVGLMIARPDFSGGVLTFRMALTVVKDRLSKLDIKTFGAYLGGGLGLGALLGLLEYEILRPEELIPDMTLGSLLALGVVMFLFVGLGEELVFRYLLQDRLKAVTGTVGAILLASLVFATMHSGYSSAPYLVYVFFIGLVFGISYEKTRSLFFVAVLHGSINFFLFSIYPYLVGN